MSSLRRFLLPEQDPFVIHTDNYLEFIKSCEDLNWNHGKPPPHRAETNRIAERAVRRVKEGTSALMVHCYLRNIKEMLAEGKTPDERRFGT